MPEPNIPAAVSRAMLFRAKPRETTIVDLRVPPAVAARARRWMHESGDDYMAEDLFFSVPEVDHAE